MTPTFKALTPAGEWVEGYRYDLWNPIQGNRIPVIDKSDRFDQDGDSVAVVEVLPETVCMATGVVDGEGKMIWEGDVRTIFGHTAVVEFSLVWCGWIFRCLDMDDEHSDLPFYNSPTPNYTDSKYIKNIHDKTAGK